MNEKVLSTDAHLESLVSNVLDEVTERLNAGEVPDIEEYVARCPEIEGTLREVFQALFLLRVPLGDSVSAEESVAPLERPLGELGEYRVLREIGRGGMGVVYEAQQKSLGRRVALKVFPFAAVWDRRQLQRFKNEAQAAATLDHPNIVQVFSVGCEQGVHYYAMQYIEGRTLADLIDRLRRSSDQNDVHDDGDSSASPSAETRRRPQAVITTEGSTGSRELFRTAADFGIQAAEALEHAHQMGVIHRDVKPSNLLVDVQGRLWITDFGLALTSTGTNLTMTGDTPGTLRYMSPEQLRDERIILDHRTDVYSLGVTLYELLTLRPAFGSMERQELMRQIIEEEPRRPQRINRVIPKDLETIVLKAIAKEPHARYASAAELAADLRRFQADEPIRARRTPLVERTARWSRRHRPLVLSAVVVLLVLTAASLVSTALIAQAYDAEATQRERADRNLATAHRAVESLLKRMERSVKELRLANSLQEVGSLVDYAVELDGQLPGEVRNSPRHRARLASMHYERGWGCTTMGNYETAERSLGSAIAIYEKLLAERPGKYEMPLARCYYYLDDTLRGLERFDEAKRAETRVKELLDDIRQTSSGPLLAEQPGEVLEHEPGGRDWWATEEGIARHDEIVRQRTRGLARAYYYRGAAYMRSRELEKALANYDKALLLDPGYPDVYWERGTIYLNLGDHDRAIADLDEGIRLAPRVDLAYNQRGLAYQNKGEHDKAIADFTQAIGLARTKTVLFSTGEVVFSKGIGHFSRGLSYRMKGRPEEALADYDEAVRLAPRFAETYYRRGSLYLDRGDSDRAIADFDELTRLQPNAVKGYHKRGLVYYRRGQFDKAIADFNQAIRLAPKEPLYYMCRGAAHQRKGHWDRAIAEYDRAIRLKPEEAENYHRRGIAYACRRDFERAIADYDRAIGLNPKHSLAYGQRGEAYRRQGDLDLAIADFDEAVRLAPKYYPGCYRRGLALAESGRVEAAAASVRQASEMDLGTARHRTELAWFLTTGPYPDLWNVERAVELAQDAVDQEPKHGAAWKALGVARYRAGDYQAAQEALETAGGFRYGTVYAYNASEPGLFFLTMAHWQQGHHQEARRCYEKAVEWMHQQRPDDEELHRFHDEAAALLSIHDPISTEMESSVASTPSSPDRGPSAD